jgi:hypothetical protein
MCGAGTVDFEDLDIVATEVETAESSRRQARIIGPDGRLCTVSSR